MTRQVLLLPGDGIGPEVVREARRVLEVVGDRYALDLAFTEANLGGVAARNEKLNALKAAAITADLQRVKHMLDEMPLTQNRQVQGAAAQLQKDLANTIAAGR